MTELPRIETSDPDQALSACRSLLALLENVAGEQKRGQLEEEACLSLASADIWQGIEIVTALVRNTLLHVELNRTPACQHRNHSPQRPR